MEKENYSLKAHNKRKKVGKTRYLLTLNISEDKGRQLYTMEGVQKNQFKRKYKTIGSLEMEQKIIIEEMPQVLMIKHQV